ncbi:hypothetical protein EYR40_004834 [Pleurotus pulmonarius]|nr:hypothetical protein EYR40_004834 [Pleurotus pulmonarius]
MSTLVSTAVVVWTVETMADGIAGSIKREIGHLCHDEQRQRATDKHHQPQQTAGSARGYGGASLGRQGIEDGVNRYSIAAPPAPSSWPLTGPFGYQSDTLGNEFSVLTDFLETLDECSFFTPLPTMTSRITPNTFSPSITATFSNESVLSQISVSSASLTGGSPALPRSAQSTHIDGNDPQPSEPILPAATKAEKFLLMAADQDSGPRDQRLKSVIRSKYEAGLLKPYNYVKGYTRLSRWMDKNVSQESKCQILQPLGVLRPKFRAIAQSLRDIDLVFIEEAFERMLLDYDRVFAAVGVPACLWRRTGEIYKANREFAELVGIDTYMMRDGRLCIYELMIEESAVNYWEKYGHVAFDSSQKAVLTSCVVRYKPAINRPAANIPTKGSAAVAADSNTNGQVAMKEREEEEGAPMEEGTINCCFSFTIRRDKWGIPRHVAFTGLQSTLCVIKDIAGNVGIPGLYAGIAGLETIISVSEQFLANDERISRLLERIMGLDIMLQGFQSGGPLPPQVYQRVAKLVLLWENEAAKISELRERNGVIKWFTAKRDEVMLEEILDSINQSIQDFMLECAFNTEIGVHRLQHDISELKRLTNHNLTLLQSSTRTARSMPNPNTTTSKNVMKRLEPNDPVFLEVHSYFNDRWLRDPKLKRPTIKAIYQVSSWSERGSSHLQKYSAYRSELRKALPNHRLIEEPLFHTHHATRQCTLGDDLSETISPCYKSSCSLCHILRCDFRDDLVRKSSDSMWGPGFYLTTASNKASYYSRNGDNHSPNRTVLFSKVLVGVPKLVSVQNPGLRAAPPGTHSIKAITKDQGGEVIYSERVVYRADAICPWVMILYHF